MESFLAAAAMRVPGVGVADPASDTGHEDQMCPHLRLGITLAGMRELYMGSFPLRLSSR